MDKKDLKKRRISIRETLANLETNLALAKSENNHMAQQAIQKLIDFFENQLKSLKEG